ncbi:MAG TPA: hypothetical protein VN397_02015 [Candidatus Methylomirabilis sp.]|nr:hypothetical protein [Candidatus Methylomirabilis sp.]
MDDEEAVHVIRHDDEFVQENVGVVVWEIDPGIHRDCSKVIQPHFSANNLPKEAFVSMRIDRHEIFPWLRIIVALEAD